MSSLEARRAHLMRCYRDVCASTGVDPKVELAEVRFDGRCTVGEWVTLRLLLDGDPHRRTPHDVTLRELSGQLWARPALWPLAPDLRDTWVVEEIAAETDPEDPELLAALAAHPNSEVRAQVAANYVTPGPVVDRLARDPNPEVRTVAASHPALTPGTLRLLAGDPNTYVRHRVAGHENTPDDTLAGLADDLDATVANAARARLPGRQDAA